MKTLMLFPFPHLLYHLHLPHPLTSFITFTSLIITSLTPSPPHLPTSPPPHSQVLQKNMQLLMDNVDTLQQDLYRLLGYEKNLAKQQQAKQQFIQRRVRLGLCAHKAAFIGYGGHPLSSRKRRTLVARHGVTLLSQSQRR